MHDVYVIQHLLTVDLHGKVATEQRSVVDSVPVPGLWGNPIVARPVIGSVVCGVDNGWRTISVNIYTSYDSKSCRFVALVDIFRVRINVGIGFSFAFHFFKALAPTSAFGLWGNIFCEAVIAACVVVLVAFGTGGSSCLTFALQFLQPPSFCIEGLQTKVELLENGIIRMPFKDVFHFLF